MKYSLCKINAIFIIQQGIVDLSVYIIDLKVMILYLVEEICGVIEKNGVIEKIRK